MIQRLSEFEKVRALLRRHPVVALLGPRQVGKTTLARQIHAQTRGKPAWFDLEDPRDLARLKDPMLSLEGLKGLVVLDEIQRAPGLFQALRVLADRPGSPARFLVLGSASPKLLRQSSESLAGRIAYHVLGGISLDEIGPGAMDTLWLRGGFPRSLLAKNEADSLEWRREFTATLLERDLPQLGVGVPAATLQRYWTMLAHYHAQTWKGSELARAFGVGEHTVRRYLDHLVSVYMVRLLLPWHENLGKRQVKSPKLYIQDSGLLHQLLDIRDRRQLERHPKVGASWEGFALNAITHRLGARPEECFFWGTQAGAELDLLVVRGKQRLGFEFKRTDSPALTPSMRHAMADLKLERLWVVHAGQGRYALAPRTEAIGLSELIKDKRWIG